MKAILFALFLVSLNLSGLAAVKANCVIDGISNKDWWYYRMKEPINDDVEGTIATFKTTNITGIKNIESKYLGASFEDDVLTIFTMEEFSNFEADFKSRKTGNPIELKLELGCTEGESKTLNIYQSVIDVNNHNPVLNQNKYEFNFAMTVPEDFEMTVFQTISAVDDDFTNNNIYFSIEDSSTIEPLKLRSTGKTVYGNDNDYFTSLSALKNITAPFKKEFTIVATDEGEPKRSTKAKVLVRVMSEGEDCNLVEDSQEQLENSVHPPVFSQHLYFGNYTVDDVELRPYLRTDPIIIKFAEDDLKIKQIGYKEYFEVKYTPKEKLDVVPIKPLPDLLLQNEQLVIEIEATNQGLSIPARTALLISCSKNTDSDEDENSVHPPVFSKHLYFANYTFDNELKMEDPITVIYGATNNMMVKQTDYKEYFKITPNTATNELKVDIIKPLTDEILKKELIVIEIEAENVGLTIPGRTALLINMPDAENGSTENNVHPPVFSKHLYLANYTLRNEIKIAEPIMVKYGATEKMIIRQSNYSEYIKINQSSINQQELHVAIVKPIPDLLFPNNLLTIEIEAQNEGLSISGRTALLIRSMKYMTATTDNCSVDHMWGFNSFSIIMFFVAILIIVFLNIIILSLYYGKQRINKATLIAKTETNKW